jgi:DNA-binding Xre family transcriptional regulator
VKRVPAVFYRSEAGNESVGDWLAGFRQSKEMKRKSRVGSSFDEFLQEEGILTETTAIAVKRVLACQFEQAMEKDKISKSEMARRMNTSRSSVNRLLDPNAPSITLQTMNSAASALGKELLIVLEDKKRGKAIV